ncbi:hypothetical protein DVH05_004316 [Phytophthora capsici]|nr:hypothetical protein DVH05_004316 [Phytophthora capsici]
MPRFAEDEVGTMPSSDADGTPSNAMMGLWGWVQRRYRSEEAEATKELLLPLPQPVTSQQHTDLITESLEEMKTQLQLIHAVVDDLQAKGEQTNRQLNGLQDQLRRVPTCRCGPQEKNTRVVAPSTKTFPSPSNAQNSRAPTFELTRLELPM